MKSNQRSYRAASVCCAAWLCLGLFHPGPGAAAPISQVLLWDTGSSRPGNPEERSGWKPVPVDLLTLEANPPKASSDPGYYGRGYVFQGEAAVENQKLLAVCSGSGRVVLYSKASGSADAAAASAPPTKVLEVAPGLTPAGAGPAAIEILRNGDDEVMLRLAPAGLSGPSLVLNFGRNEIVEVNPTPEFKAFTVTAPCEYAVIPGFIGDDLIYGAQETNSGDALAVPSENCLLGLLQGEATQFVMTWPKGKQRVRLALGAEANGRRPIEAVQFENDGQSFYLAPMAAAGIWHREELAATDLEKDVATGWRRPFPARWKTELDEQDVKTSYAFRPGRGDIWRGVAGSYDYPVWFDGDQAFYHLSKKVPPKGQSVIYFLEGQGTPLSIMTPADVLNQTLGRSLAGAILDVRGRKLRTHHRRGGEGVHRACTCGCTEAVQAIFESGEEVERKSDVHGDLEDMVYFVHRHVERINEYRRFADDLSRYLRTQKAAAPDLGPYIDGLDQIVQQIPQEYTVQQENMKSFAYADDLFKRTMALTDKKDPGNVKAYMELLKEWRGMGGAQDYVLAQCHIIARKLAQEAGYRCANQPQAVSLAEEVRAKTRQILRNPDGYEVWADY